MCPDGSSGKSVDSGLVRSYSAVAVLFLLLAL